MKILDIISEDMENNDERLERLIKRGKPVFNALKKGLTRYVHYNPDDNNVYHYEFRYEIDDSNPYYTFNNNNQLHIFPRQITIFGGRLPYSKRAIFDNVINQFRQFNIILDIQENTLVYVDSMEYMEPKKEMSLADSYNNHFINENTEDITKIEDNTRKVYKGLKKGVTSNNIHYELPDDYKHMVYPDGQTTIDVDQHKIKFYNIVNGEKEYLSIQNEITFLDLFRPIRNKFEKFKINLYRYEIPKRPITKP